MGKLTLIASLFLLASGWSCSQNLETHGASEVKERSMTLLENNRQPSPPVLPPIDTAAPAVFETATFGLG
jgi:hypothetical protein